MVEDLLCSGNGRQHSGGDGALSDQRNNMPFSEQSEFKMGRGISAVAIWFSAA